MGFTICSRAEVPEKRKPVIREKIIIIKVQRDWEEGVDLTHPRGIDANIQPLYA
jgi:hypothetical protein